MVKSYNNYGINLIIVAKVRPLNTRTYKYNNLRDIYRLFLFFRFQAGFALFILHHKLHVLVLFQPAA